MSLRSAVDDLTTTTLAVFPGLLAKLKYVAGLRGDDGNYAHWGLSRVYGDSAAQRALAETHGVLTGEILRTPLRNLMEDAEACGSAQSEPAAAYLQDLQQKGSGLLPENAGGGATRHFSSVLVALSALARNRQRATRPAS